MEAIAEQKKLMEIKEQEKIRIREEKKKKKKEEMEESKVYVSP